MGLFIDWLLFYVIATVFQLLLDGDMIYEMRRWKREPTLLLTQGIFNLPHNIGMVWEELAFDNAVSYTLRSLVVGINRIGKGRQDNVTEWDIRSWFWQPDFPMGQHYKVAMSL